MESLIIYMTKDEDEMIEISGGMLTQSRNTRILRDSYDCRPYLERGVEIGERLMCSAVVSAGQRRILPTDWVVTEVEAYTPHGYPSCFQEIIIAYCERQPLSDQEFAEMICSNSVKA